ncbi:MAG: hypothetical protein COT73_01790 [Bdellovibrio sp. CG10_big_fil_rev_8_21_14_0_10_47_8]|nr:MAG: hypothetical protein COT73_01790 [Bdellovibrio sp. CG10_big_fil_rev_8_21_14_0_10_47_8]
MLVGLFASGISFAKAPSKDTSIQVRQEFDRRLAQVKVDLVAQKDRSLKWGILLRFEESAKKMRRENSRQLEQDEVHMNTVLRTLREIPRRSDFEPNSCARYRRRILSEYDPHGENPSVAVTLKILEIVCQ